jgi:hypothetical protein
MPPRKIRFGEGDLFGVPLTTGGFAAGLVARRDSAGLTFGYFFGPRRNSMPSIGEFGELSAAAAVYVRIFGHYPLIAGVWPLIGRMENWHRDEFPLPAFCRSPPKGHEQDGCLLVWHDDSNFLYPVRRARVTREECERFPADGVCGYATVAEELDCILDPAELQARLAEPDGPLFPRAPRTSDALKLCFDLFTVAD